MNRLLLLSFLFFTLTPCSHAQRSKGELQAYVDKYKPGNALGSDSYLIGIAGDTISFSEFRGKWVLIDYWAVGCKPCLKELPSLIEFSETARLDQLEIIAVSVDTDMDRWKRLSVRRLDVLPNYFAGRSAKNDMLGLNLSLLEAEGKTSLYTTLPRYSLIDPAGRIVVRHLEEKPSSPTFGDHIRALMQ